MKKIKIAGFVGNSFVDWPGKIASVVFLGGCNFSCHYCHNNHILKKDSNDKDFEKAFEQIKERRGFIDGVVISGGEPTLHADLEFIIKSVKELGLLVKLDTNGTDFALLKRLVERGLVDYVAMDIKAPLERYKDIVNTGSAAMLAEISKSVEFLKSQDKADYMFRTTLSPFLGLADIKGIAELVNGARCFQLQQFVPNDFSNSAEVVCLPHSKETAEGFGAVISKFVNSVVLKGF